MLRKLRTLEVDVVNHSYIVTDDLFKALYHIFVLRLINDNKVLTDTLCTISEEALNIIKRRLSGVRIRYSVICYPIKVTDTISEVFKSLK
jgi:hypothetical protein